MLNVQISPKGGKNLRVRVRDNGSCDFSAEDIRAQYDRKKELVVNYDSILKSKYFDPFSSVPLVVNYLRKTLKDDQANIIIKSKSQEEKCHALNQTSPLQ